MNVDGIILVNEDNSKKYYKSFDECPIPNEILLNMLWDHHLSKKYGCRAFQAGNVPDEYEYLFEDEEQLF